MRYNPKNLIHIPKRLQDLYFSPLQYLHKCFLLFLGIILNSANAGEREHQYSIHNEKGYLLALLVVSIYDFDSPYDQNTAFRVIKKTLQFNQKKPGLRSPATKGPIEVFVIERYMLDDTHERTPQGPPISSGMFFVGQNNPALGQTVQLLHEEKLRLIDFLRNTSKSSLPEKRTRIGFCHRPSQESELVICDISNHFMSAIKTLPTRGLNSPQTHTLKDVRQINIANLPQLKSSTCTLYPTMNMKSETTMSCSHPIGGNRKYEIPNAVSIEFTPPTDTAPADKDILQISYTYTFKQGATRGEANIFHMNLLEDSYDKTLTQCNMDELDFLLGILQLPWPVLPEVRRPNMQATDSIPEDITDLINTFTKTVPLSQHILPASTHRPVLHPQNPTPLSLPVRSSIVPRGTPIVAAPLPAVSVTSPNTPNFAHPHKRLPVSTSEHYLNPQQLTTNLQRLNLNRSPYQSPMHSTSSSLSNSSSSLSQSQKSSTLTLPPISPATPTPKPY